MIKIYKYGEVPNSEVFARSEAKVDVEAIVTGIIENVKKNGDAALKEYSEITNCDVSVLEYAINEDFFDIVV